MSQSYIRPSQSSSAAERPGRLVRSLLTSLVAAVLLGGFATDSSAQAPPFRIGAILGVNYNTIELDDAGVDFYDVFGPRSFNDAVGRGFAPYIGGFFSYVPGTFGFEGRAVYNGMGGTFVETSPVDVQTSVAYFSLEPALRISQTTTGLHFLIGPSFDFEVTNSIQFPDPTDPNQSSIFPIVGLKANTISLFGGVGYDIVLDQKGQGPEKQSWLLTPFVSVHHAPEQSGNVERDWSTTSVRAGLKLAYAWNDAEREQIATVPPPAPTLGGIDLEVETPATLVGGSRQIDEFFPLLNYLFFPPSSARLPESYHLLSPSEAARFSERSLMAEGPAAGPHDPGNRVARQLRVYDNVLNVIGARMRENPATSITLVGADRDLEIAEDRATLLKSYLVSTFGIDPSRITTRQVVRPPHASGTRSTPKSDLGYVTEENRRVEILSEDNVLLRPVRINSTGENPMENDILFRLNLRSSSSISTWDLLVDQIDGDFRQAYGPFYSGVARINSTPLATAGGERFRATARGVTFTGDTVAVTEEFSLGALGAEAGAATRFSILFEYDDSKSVSTYEEFLVGEVAPRVPDGATVYVFGHTDLTGTENYNRSLSARRAAETETILSGELARLGRTARFDTYGFGEAPFRAPFGNASPEERYYNRTVIIEIVPASP